MRRGRRPGLLSTWLSDQSVRRIEALWAQRSRLLGALESLPRTLCHHDATRRNLGATRIDGRTRTIAIDWQGLGIGHLGEELAPMVAVSLQFLDAPVASARELSMAAVDGYVDGLREAGWGGDPGIVDFGFRAASCLFMGLGGAGVWFSAINQAQVDEGMVERIIGHPVDEIAE